jgi:predicted deacetylase
MRYVILRDDDTNALTPVECLERLYRPFLDRGLPVNLAVIPQVRTDISRFAGQPEGFLFAKNGETRTMVPIGDNTKLVNYLRDNSGYQIVQHGCHHSVFEFELKSAPDVRRLLEQGSRALREAGFQASQAFVAPYDRFSRASLREVARRFRVISTGWFELRRLPYEWWPSYAARVFLQRSHWRAGRAILLAHPGCLLSHNRPCADMLDTVKKSVLSRRLTVLVTHWWEYFSGGKTNEPFIQVLHETAKWLATQRDVKVISFNDVAEGKAPLN